jgi:hypothetical protein
MEIEGLLTTYDWVRGLKFRGTATIGIGLPFFLSAIGSDTGAEAVTEAGTGAGRFPLAMSETRESESFIARKSDLSVTSTWEVILSCWTGSARGFDRVDSVEVSFLSPFEVVNCGKSGVGLTIFSAAVFSPFLDLLESAFLKDLLLDTELLLYFLQ